MAKFKVGDRVRCINAVSDGILSEGKIYEVVGHDRYDWVILSGCSRAGASSGWMEARFEIVNDLKLEKGATVRLKDGVDEWVVTYASSKYFDAERGNARLIDVLIQNAVVVKEKPEYPKPDYYVNCKGAEPKDGDMFTDSHDQVCLIRGDHYHVCGPHLEKGFPLAGGVRVNAINNTRTKRTLAVRDGKPYTG